VNAPAKVSRTGASGFSIRRCEHIPHSAHKTDGLDLPPAVHPQRLRTTRCCIAAIIRITPRKHNSL